MVRAGAGRIRCPICKTERETAEHPDRYHRACEGKPPAKGLGDVVAGLLEAVGIKKKSGCGCEARQNWLNRWWPFGAK
jgi:hypothetical protein